ncbi:MAG: hypothetical protein OSJ43_09750 [Oscillospiraceae bacterium]|nr:hypothetical protein [Oscillospiraceae bacterium]
MDLDVLKGIRRNLVLLAMLELAGGLFMIIFSSNLVVMLIKILGIIAAAYGIITFLVWAVKKDKSGGAAVIITSVLGVVAGALLIFLTEHIKVFFTIIAGIFAGIFGVVKIPSMFAVKKAGFKKWYIMLIPMLAIVAIGIFIGINYGNYSDKVTSILLGISLILGCAFDIIAMAGASNVEKQLLVAKEVDMPEDELK